MSDKVFLVLSTCGDAATADTIARTLVSERLAACVNLQGGLRSVYRWGCGIQADDENLLMINTTETRLPALTRRLEALHPDELPEIVAVPVTAGLTPYLDWVAEECRDPAAAS